GARRLRHGDRLRRGLAGAAGAVSVRQRPARAGHRRRADAGGAVRRRHREGAGGRRLRAAVGSRGDGAGGRLWRAQLRSRSARVARARRRRPLMGRVLLVAAGGALGSALRYLVANAALAWLGPTFPWGTLVVNLVGSFLIGLVQSLATEALVIGEETRLLLTTGVMGGLTTYSAFSYETVRLFEAGAARRGLVNVMWAAGG